MILIITNIQWSKWKGKENQFREYSPSIYINKRDDALKAVLKCMKMSNSPHGYPNITVHSANEIYSEFLRINKIANRISGPNVSTHKIRHMQGKWLENIWINKTIYWNPNKFSYYVPLLVPWTDIYFQLKSKKNRKYKKFTKKLMKNLIPDFLYVTISQHDHGIEGTMFINPHIPPNLFIFSAGGRGHVPIPLYLLEHEIIEPIRQSFKVIFLGSSKNFKRTELVAQFKNYFREEMFTSDIMYDWKSYYQKSAFILSPRGTARGCSRLTDIILLGFIPIVVFDETIWLPYKTKLNWNEFSFVMLEKEIPKYLPIINATTQEEIDKMRRKVIEIRNSHFTIEAILDQIDKFLNSGGEDSDLECDKYMVDKFSIPQYIRKELNETNTTIESFFKAEGVDPIYLH